MYYVELIGALVLTGHACLVIACLDHLKKLPLLRTSIKFTKALLIFYGFIIFLRSILYLFWIRPVLPSHDKYNLLVSTFTNFLASYMTKDQGVALYVTFGLLFCFGMCFAMQIYQMRVISRLM
jgi:hypothetical protein